MLSLGLIGLFLYSVIGLLVVLPVQANTSCVPLYGGGPTCTSASTIALQSQVLNPSTNTFVHNLGLTDATYISGDVVTFQVSLTNTGNEPIQQITVKDSFPGVLTFVDGPGIFDKTHHILTFTLTNLAPKRSQLFTITARVGASSYPQNCVNNEIVAIPSSGTLEEDSSQFCLKQTLSTTPATGAEVWGLLPLLPIGLIGWKLKKLRFI